MTLQRQTYLLQACAIFTMAALLLLMDRSIRQGQYPWLVIQILCFASNAWILARLAKIRARRRSKP